MASHILFLNKPFVSVGLDDFTHTIAATGLYSVQCDSTEVPPSGMSFVVNVGGSPVYTAPVLTPTQGEVQFKTQALSLTAADVVTVVLTSAVAGDALLNNVKSIVSIQQGF